MKLLILGAGGHGVNCLEIARRMGSFEEIAFLDDGHVDEEICGCLVIGKLEAAENLQAIYDCAFPAFGNNSYRLKWLGQLISAGYTIPVLISPQACVSTYAVIGQGSVVFPFVSVEPRAKISQGAIISAGVVINHDSRLGDGVLIYSNSVIRPYASVETETRIGSAVVIAQGCKVASESNIADGIVLN